MLPTHCALVVAGWLQFGSTLQPADLLTPQGYLQNLATWMIKQAAMPVLTGLRPTPWSAIRDRLQLPRASSNCPVVDAVLFLAGHRVKRCDVLLNAIMVSRQDKRSAYMCSRHAFTSGRHCYRCDMCAMLLQQAACSV